MRRLAAIAAFSAILLAAQTPEQDELNRTLAEAGNSPVDLIRGLEQYLKKYPETQQLPAIEKALAKAAMDSNDSARIVLYGEKALQMPPPDDTGLLDRVIRELIEKGDPDSAQQAIVYAARYEADIAALRGRTPPLHLTPGQWSEQLDRAQARALALRAQAIGNTGGDSAEEALKTARMSWDAYPTAEGAREAALWLTKLGRNEEALSAYADAFTVEDSQTNETDRARDRTRMGALYTKLHGSENGLGDLILQAYDRNAALLSARRAGMKLKDPNAQAVNIFDFTLPAMDGSPSLPLSSLKGKTVVMDFWATWCVPCRAQHPLIEDVKKKYADKSDVVFLAVDADDDPSLVTPFLKEQGWPGPVYYEDGLERRLVIASIPTVLVLNPGGQVTSRISGFVPDRFEGVLGERIEEARGK
jgi:thiol-disulfide isomerase/thioredoxin